MKRTLTTTLCVVALFLTGVLLSMGRVSGSGTPAAPVQDAASSKKSAEFAFSKPLPRTGKIGWTRKVLAGIEVNSIPAGAFQMGSSEREAREAFQNARDFFGDSIEPGRYSLEQPKHRVVMTAPFWMGKFEVTQAQWESVMGTNPSHFRNCPTCPVESVNWDDCQAFIRKLNAKGDGNTYALPTEAQWEYACRAGTTTPFSFGATITPGQVNYNGNFPFGSAARGVYREKTIPVGSLKSPNAWGLHDMHGNVAEWCADWFLKDYYKDSPTIDPKGPSSGELHVLRGGTWINIAVASRSADRSGGSPEARNFNVGFRVVVHSSKQ